MLLDDNPTPGGQIWRGRDPRDPWSRRLRASGVRVITGARIISGDAVRRTLTIETAVAAFIVPYRKLILATGAREIFLPFPGWTEPKVFGVGGLQALAKSGFSVAGKRIIVSGTGPFLLAAATSFQEHGAVVPLIAEQTSRRALFRFATKLFRHPGKLVQALRLRLQLRRTRYLTSCWVEQASDELATIRRGAKVWQEQFDFLATGYGFRPNTELAAALGCTLHADAIQVDEFQQTSIPDIYAAGECTGIGGVDLALSEGRVAGFAACGQPSRSKRPPNPAFSQALNEAFTLRPELRTLPDDDTIICRCEDVRWRALRDSRSRREAKLYTRCGMGPCQGRICGQILDFLCSPDCDNPRTPVFPARLETLTTTEELAPK